VKESEFQALKDKVQALVLKWKDKLRLQGWRITCEYYHDHIPNTEDKGPISKVAGKVYPLWEYKKATIKWCMDALDELDDDELEEIIIHELVHILIAELQEWREDPPNGIKHEERVVTDLSWIIMELGKPVKEETDEGSSS
jgi:hypothetical protein